MASQNATSSSGQMLTNYCSYVDPDTGLSRIGSLSADGNTIQPLAFVSGTPLSNLYEVIEAGESRIIPSGEPLKVLQESVAREQSIEEVIYKSSVESTHSFSAAADSVITFWEDCTEENQLEKVAKMEAVVQQ